MYQAGVTSVVLGEKIERRDSKLTDDAVLAMGANIAVYADQTFSRDNPDISVVVPPDYRITFIRPPTTRSPAMFLRKLRRRAFPLEKYVADGTMTWEQKVAIEAMVVERRTVLISGSTGSGKTTLLRTLLNLVDSGEHVVTIEDATELQLVDEKGVRRPNWTDFEASAARDMAALLRLALRCRPDRIIVGEVRGPEALELIRACNTGHKGGLFTVHSNGAEEAIDRLHMAALQAQPSLPRRIVEQALDVVIQIEGLSVETRKITEIWRRDVTS